VLLQISEIKYVLNFHFTVLARSLDTSLVYEYYFDRALFRNMCLFASVVKQTLQPVGR